MAKNFFYRSVSRKEKTIMSGRWPKKRLGTPCLVCACLQPASYPVAYWAAGQGRPQCRLERTVSECVGLRLQNWFAPNVSVFTCSGPEPYVVTQQPTGPGLHDQCLFAPQCPSEPDSGQFSSCSSPAGQQGQVALSVCLRRLSRSAPQRRLPLDRFLSHLSLLLQHHTQSFWFRFVPTKRTGASPAGPPTIYPSIVVQITLVVGHDRLASGKRFAILAILAQFTGQNGFKAL